MKKGKNASTLHILFDNLYNSHRILQYKDDTIKFTTKVALRHAILNTIYAHNLPFSCKQSSDSRNSIFGVASRWEFENITYTPAGAVDFSLIRSTQTISGAHPASNLMQTRGSIPTGNANGALANQ